MYSQFLTPLNALIKKSSYFYMFALINITVATMLLHLHNKEAMKQTRLNSFEYSQISMYNKSVH